MGVALVRKCGTGRKLVLNPSSPGEGLSGHSCRSFLLKSERCCPLHQVDNSHYFFNFYYAILLSFHHLLASTRLPLLDNYFPIISNIKNPVMQ